MTEEMFARAKAKRAPQTFDIRITVSKRGGPRYPAHVVIPANATWDDLILAWHQQCETVGVTEHTRLPTVASAYDFRNSRNEDALNLRNGSSIFANPDVPLTEPATPETVEVNVIYEHLSVRRVYIKQGLRMHVKPNVSSQAVQRASLIRAPGEKDWLDRLRKKEAFLVWDQFQAQLIPGVATVAEEAIGH
jgi:hypothetical protein